MGELLSPLYQRCLASELGGEPLSTSLSVPGPRLAQTCVGPVHAVHGLFRSYVHQSCCVCSSCLSASSSAEIPDPPGQGVGEDVPSLLLSSCGSPC